MPELPEVETIRRSLARFLPGLTILEVAVSEGTRVLRHTDPARFCREVRGQTFRELTRRGKYLTCHFVSGRMLTFHLRMTGKLIYTEPSEPPARHTALIFSLSDGNHLRFVDQRKFGAVYLHDSPEEVAGIASIGPEPLSDDFTLEVLTSILKGRKAKVKSVLLDQRRIAGIGNIYADESLFRAGINPERPAGSLSEDEIARLHLAIRASLLEGLDHGGTSFKDYVDGIGQRGRFQEQLCVYGRDGKPCPNCGHLLKRAKVGGRGTVYCAHCQS